MLLGVLAGDTLAADMVSGEGVGVAGRAAVVFPLEGETKRESVPVVVVTPGAWVGSGVGVGIRAPG